ncbi:MAG: hypothetical protein ACPGJE_04260, partial [Wenzhouxiangellaceae bacterium]
MAATTDDNAPADADWLRRRTPAWLRLSLVALALLEAVLVVTQAGALAWIAGAALIDRASLTLLMPALLILLAAFALRALVQGARQWRVADASVALRRKVRAELLVALRRPDPA